MTILTSRFKMDESTSLVSAEESARLGGVWKKRSRLEQVLIALLTCCFIVIFALSIAVGVHRKDKEHDELCTSQSCITAAADLFRSMDTSVNPCEDFYEYSCKTWIDDTTIIDQVSDRFSALSNKMNLKLKDLLENSTANASGNFTGPAHFVKAQKFYHACKNFTEREDAGLTSFLNDLKSFGGFPALMGDKWNDSNFDYIDVMKKMLDRGYDHGILLSISLDKDLRNNSFERISIHQTSPGMNQQSLFKDDHAMLIYETYTTLYVEYLCGEVNSTCKVPPERIKREIEDAIALEKNITEMLYTPDYLEIKENVYNVMPIKKLSAIANETDWLRLIKVYFPNITSITENTEIMVTVPEFMKNFSSYIHNVIQTPEGRRNLANYMMYRHVKEAATHLSRDIKRAYYDFQGQLKGEFKIPDLWDECVSFTAAIFDLSLGAQYIRAFFPKERKKAIEDLVEGIKVELATILKNTRWMDNSTIDRALKKLNKIYLMAVYPDDLLNDTKLDDWYKKLLVGGSHYENYVQSNLFVYEKAVEGFGYPLDTSNWKFLPSSILESNAYYSGTNNSVFVPLGISQSWFFEENGPIYVNYGRMGFVLAHELSHAFDVRGADLDENGNWKNWWQNDTLAQFRNNSKCMINMFDKYYSKEANLTLNGSRTITENIADDIGIAEVYAAFKKAIVGIPAQRLPGHNLTAEKLFWVNYASIWCEKDTDDYYVDLISNDVHSPSKYRVNSPLANNKDFLSDFNCRAGDRMFRNESHCHVWGVESSSK